MDLSPTARFVVRRDGKDYGPYDGATLSRYVAEGSIDADDLVRLESGSTWSTVGELMPATAKPPPVPPVPPGPAAPPVVPVATAPGLPAVSYVGGVLVTIFCCQVTGAIALVYAGLANTAAARGDAAEYASSRSQATVWLWVSVAMGIVLCCGYGVVQWSLASAMQGLGGSGLGS